MYRYKGCSPELLEVASDRVQYTAEEIVTNYEYLSTSVCVDESSGKVRATPRRSTVEFRTKRKVGRVGALIVGIGGNNGSTLVASILANKKGLSWRTKRGFREANYFGSLTLASTVALGTDDAGNEVFVPFNSLLPMVNPNELVIGGWDISSLNLGDAMRRAGVLDVQLQDQLYDDMKKIVPMPSVFFPEYVAANQKDRANNVLKGSKAAQIERLKSDIDAFKREHELDTVIVLWSANTECYVDIKEGVNDSMASLLSLIEKDQDGIAPSTIFAVASIQSGCAYINGSPQNTFVPGVIELAEHEKVYIGGDDFKSGQTKYKSALVDFLVGAGIAPRSIVSYNHLGNNDGKNLSAPQQFRSKEISKSNVVDDMVASNGILYKDGDKPDHCVVIKYVPHVGDSKRAIDEYACEIFMGGEQTIVSHNTCEDSLLATPLILDLIIITELMQRVTFKVEGEEEVHGFHAVLSLLSYMLKAPLTPPGRPVVNSLFSQREALVNFLRAFIGLAPNSYMGLQHRLPRKDI